MISISVETRAGMTRHHLDSAIAAFAIVEHMQKETHLPIVITNRATGHVLTVEELRHLANLERSRAHRPQEAPRRLPDEATHDDCQPKGQSWRQQQIGSAARRAYSGHVRETNVLSIE